MNTGQPAEDDTNDDNNSRYYVNANFPDFATLTAERRHARFRDEWRAILQIERRPKGTSEARLDKPL
jgi:hypothetical protein